MNEATAGAGGVPRSRDEVRAGSPGALGINCWDCGEVITSDITRDNRYRGCRICGWVMHHACWIEHLTDGTLPCPTETVVVEAVYWKNGKLRYPADQHEEMLDGHNGVIGMRGEWENDW